MYYVKLHQLCGNVILYYNYVKCKQSVWRESPQGSTSIRQLSKISAKKVLAHMKLIECVLKKKYPKPSEEKNKS
eukprot:snap_masked-scaffold_2-processed-gene-6.11-mRNA-1 protein AED:1.00 eAED:1.00 QI:0/0/0/0/1/1/2/0/73